MSRTAHRISGLLGVLGLLASVPLLLMSAEAEDPKIRIVADAEGRPLAFETGKLPAPLLAALRDLPAGDERFTRYLTVHVVDESAKEDLPAVLGTYTLQEGALRFKPRFKLRPGLRYRVIFRPDGDRTEAINARPVVREVTVPTADQGPPAEVTQVYPSGETVPENLLRLYIHFSAPMSRGEAYKHIWLLDGDGRPVDLPFLELTEELWDKTGQRLTVLIDPGRVKREVKPREDLGPVFEAGREYTLVIDAGWKDATGRLLREGSRKTYRAAAPIESAIDSSAWKIETPPADSGGALVIRFPRSLDRALLGRTLTVRDAAGDLLQGSVAISDAERRWEFLPDSPLSSGRYQLVVETVLEDVSGNRIGRAFEVDQFPQVELQSRDEPFVMPFEVSPLKEPKSPRAASRNKSSRLQGAAR